MNIDDILKMTPEQFAESWRKNDDIIHTALAELEGATPAPVMQIEINL